MARGGGGRQRLRLPLSWGASLLLVLLFCLLAAGCEDVRRNFLPLAAGNSWTYRVRSGDSDLGRESLRVIEELGHDRSPASPALEPPDSVHSGRVGRREGRKDKDAARRFRVAEPGGPAVWVKDRGTVVRSAGRAGTVVLQYPPFVGTGWIDEAPDGSAVYVKVLAREAVRTPAGWFFDCVVVRREAEDRSSVVTQWFAPDVGLVRWRVERRAAPAVEWVLESYQLEAE